MPNESSNKKIVCVIPARLNSSRFPRKILASLNGKTLLQNTFEAALKVATFNNVTIAIDSKETAKVVESFGAPYIMTSENCASGTERLIEVMQGGKVEGDVWVNWQADDPFVNPEMITELLPSLEGTDVWTLKKEITKPEEINSPNAVKVVCNAKDEALFFSRSTIPFFCDGAQKKYFRHIGIYAYTNESLKKIAKMPPCYLEQAERLEQLRFLYHGLTIKVYTTTHEVVSINTPEDLKNAEIFLTRCHEKNITTSNTV